MSPPAQGIDKARKLRHPFSPKRFREVTQQPADNRPPEAVLVGWVQHTLIVGWVFCLSRHGFENFRARDYLCEHEQDRAISCDKYVSFPDLVRVKYVIPLAPDRKVILHAK